MSAIVFISKDENLTKAHVRYLESRLISEAAQISQIHLIRTSLEAQSLLAQSSISKDASILSVDLFCVSNVRTLYSLQPTQLHPLPQPSIAQQREQPEKKFCSLLCLFCNRHLALALNKLRPLMKEIFLC